MKILWLSNKAFSGDDTIGTGTWLTSLSNSLAQSGELKLGNISIGKRQGLIKTDYNNISQYLISPKARNLNKNGLPSKSVINEIKFAIEDFLPDIIHIWGTELFWSLLTARKIITLPTLLEIQGLKSAIVKVYDGGLTFKEKIACIGIKEIIRRSTLFHIKSEYLWWSLYEKEIIAGHSFITTQSPWLESQIKSINHSCEIFHNEFTLQKPFYSAASWRFSNNFKVFCSTSYPSPFKGLHVALRATAILKKRFPNIQLRIAGAHQKKGIRQDGFVNWLNNEAKKMDIQNNLIWLGPLPVEDIIKELQNCAVTLLPTFIEGYCLALAEAMAIGSPTVVSFTGGTSYLAKDNDTALFFPPGDEAMCAYQIERLLLDRSLSENLSFKSRKIALERNNPNLVINNQINIYRRIINSV